MFKKKLLYAFSCGWILSTLACGSEPIEETKPLIELPLNLNGYFSQCQNQELSIEAKGNISGATWRLGGTLPTGLRFVTEAFAPPTISGAATSTGSYPIVIYATDNAGTTVEQNYTLQVTEALPHQRWLALLGRPKDEPLTEPGYYLLNICGSTAEEPHRISRTPSYALKAQEISFSPQQAWLLFAENGRQQNRVNFYLHDLNAVQQPSQRLKLPSLPEGDTNYYDSAWSPDGKKLYLSLEGTQTNASGTKSIAAYWVALNSAANLTDVQRIPIEDLSPLPHAPHRWSPDSRYIAIGPAAITESEVYIQPTEGSASSAFLLIDPQTGANCAIKRWSHRPGKVYCSAGRQNGQVFQEQLLEITITPDGVSSALALGEVYQAHISEDERFIAGFSHSGTRKYQESLVVIDRTYNKTQTVKLSQFGPDIESVDIVGFSGAAKSLWFSVFQKAHQEVGQRSLVRLPLLGDKAFIPQVSTIEAEYLAQFSPSKKHLIVADIALSVRGSIDRIPYYLIRADEDDHLSLTKSIQADSSTLDYFKWNPSGTHFIAALTHYQGQSTTQTGGVFPVKEGEEYTGTPELKTFPGYLGTGLWSEDGLRYLYTEQEGDSVYEYNFAVSPPSRKRLSQSLEQSLSLTVPEYQYPGSHRSALPRWVPTPQ